MKFFEHCAKKNRKKCNFIHFFKKHTKLLGYLGIVFDTHFIPLQNEPSPILVGPKPGATFQFECWKRHFSVEQL